MNWKAGLNPINIANYLRQEQLYWSYLNDQKLANQFVQSYLPYAAGDTNRRVLDFGCGRGRHVAMLSQLGFDVTGVDTQESSWWTMLKRAKMQTIRDSYDLALMPDNYDLCLCFLVLYLVDADDWVLSQFHRVLKPGGYLVLQVPNAENLWTKKTGRYLNNVEPIKKYYTAESITGKLERAGFKVARLWYGKYYPPRFLKAVNCVLGLLPSCVDKWLANRIPERNRGVINVWAQKPHE